MAKKDTEVKELKPFKLSSTEKKKQDEIKEAILEELKKNSTYCQPFLDRVERYLQLRETALELEFDIKQRGVKHLTTTGYKKNDSVAMLVNINKQMDLMLEKLGVSTSKIKTDDGMEL